ncbi:MAG: hypothetical protein LLF94_04090 [Chlamydiales bacterium]|nr:hypothetical protein [Chlamydiales bacterium]
MIDSNVKLNTIDALIKFYEVAACEGKENTEMQELCENIKTLVSGVLIRSQAPVAQEAMRKINHVVKHSSTVQKSFIEKNIVTDFRGLEFDIHMLFWASLKAVRQKEGVDVNQYINCDDSWKNLEKEESDTVVLLGLFKISKPIPQ